MNRADVELLDRSIQGLGNSFLQNRELAQQERERELDRQMRTQVAQDQSAARQQYYNWRERDADASAQARQDTAGERAQTLDLAKQRLQGQQSQGQLQDKQRFLQMMIGLNAGGQLDDDARDNFNEWLSNDEHFGATGIQLSEPPKAAPPQAGQNSVAAALNAANNYRTQARGFQQGDPRIAQFTKYATTLENSVDPTAYDEVEATVGADRNGKGGYKVRQKIPRGSAAAPGNGISTDGYLQWAKGQQPVSQAPGATPPAPNPFGAGLEDPNNPPSP